ncbi:hypothetical protein FisN_1Lu385 [Fistulifera solaris]|uniref:PH domain-containing protein n=1 Tax=Fistulifera solaris TaxID=1519565 RepID=A0A1Z5K3Y2_FISSO|nr:hypothetical protein FisN_1Lu385 [Fistulifera solaris]|eukprot:GAX20954.1 hypothetical protein FisN_1Lu385 [Fistulifera solaris]
MKKDTCCKRKYDRFFHLSMSQGQLRQRRGSTAEIMSKGSASSPLALSRSALLKASPQEHGPVRKLHIPLIYSLLPRFIQRCVASVPVLNRFSCPSWEARYLVLLGSYLYKFEDHVTQRDTPSHPKGSPLALSSLEAFIVDNNSLRCLPIGNERTPLEVGTLFCVSTFRKQYYYCASDHEQALVWVNSIMEAKQEAVKRSMGHAQTDSYPKSWEYYDRLGRSLKSQNERIRMRVERKELQELEMRPLMEGAPLSRGYFG